MQGNNTYTVVAAFDVTFPSINSEITGFDPGLIPFQDGIRLNPLGNDIYVALETNGFPMINPTGTFETIPCVANGNWGNWIRKRTGVSLNDERTEFNFRMGGTPSGGGRAGTIRVYMYVKPSESSAGQFDFRPNGGAFTQHNYFPTPVITP
jgi:hypothetical protein